MLEGMTLPGLMDMHTHLSHASDEHGYRSLGTFATHNKLRITNYSRKLSALFT